MQALRTSGPRSTRRLLEALVVLILALAVAPAAGMAAPAKTPAVTPKATAAAISLQLRVAERQRSHVRTLVRRACAAGATKRCRARRARLAKAEAREAMLRRTVRRRTTGRPTTSAGTTPATGTTTATGKKPVATSPAPASTTSPAPAPASAADRALNFQPGIVSGTTFEYDIPGAQRLGAKQVRLEFPIESSAAYLQNAIARYADAGIRVLPLAGFAGRIPTVADARNLASWAAAYGPGGTFWADRSDGRLAIQDIEFGNETSGGYQYGDGAETDSYKQRAQIYAVRVRDAAQAIRATGMNVGVLAQVDDWTGIWVDNMYKSVPDLHNYVDGWTTHPYGSDWKSKIDDAVNHTAAHGAPNTIPIDVTEWGMASDGGRCLNDNYGLNPCMTFAQAAATMHNSIAGMKAALGGRLRTFMLYQVRDQADPGTSIEREAYFGLQTHFLQDKGALTAQARVELAATS
jgi:hypothetical protein